jgi:hypothetical protein
MYHKMLITRNRFRGIDASSPGSSVGILEQSMGATAMNRVGI